jgi:hypothetical protein
MFIDTLLAIYVLQRVDKIGTVDVALQWEMRFLGYMLPNLRLCSVCFAVFGTCLYLVSTDFVGVRRDVICDVNLMSFAPRCCIYRLLTAASNLTRLFHKVRIKQMTRRVPILVSNQSSSSFAATLL